LFSLQGEFRIHLVQLVDEVAAEEGVQVLAVAVELPVAGILSFGPRGDDRRGFLNRPPQQPQRLRREEPRNVHVSFDAAGDLFHPVAVFAIDLHREHADLHLTDWRVDLVDHRADFVDPADRAAKLDEALANDADRHARDRVGRIDVTRNVGVGIGRRGGDFCPELVLGRAVFGRLRPSHLAPPFALGLPRPRHAAFEFRHAAGQ